MYFSLSDTCLFQFAFNAGIEYVEIFLDIRDWINRIKFFIALNFMDLVFYRFVLL